MTTEYLDILREWQTKVLKPCVYEHVDALFPAYQFRRMNPGGPKDHWASRYKMDKTIPKNKIAAKTVIYQSEMHFREQGEWSGSSIGILDFYMKENGIRSLYEACQALDARFGLNMPRKDSPDIVAKVQKRARKDALLEDLMGYFAWNLENNSSDKAQKTRSYLAKERGFTKEQISRLNLGFVPDWGTVMRFITQRKGYTIEELEAACEVRNAEGKTTVGKTHTLAIPYECAGVLKGFIFRKIENKEGPKYIASQELDRKSAFFNIRHTVSRLPFGYGLPCYSNLFCKLLLRQFIQLSQLYQVFLEHFFFPFLIPRVNQLRTGILEIISNRSSPPPIDVTIPIM